MTSRTTIASFCLVVSAALAHAEPAPVTLSWQFEKGVPIFQEVSVSLATLVESPGIPLDTGRDYTLWIRWTPARQLPDGRWVLKQRIEGMQIRTRLSATSSEYDTTRPVREEDITPQTRNFHILAQELLASEFRITLDSQGRVTDVVESDLLHRLGKRNPDLPHYFGSYFDAEGLKRLATTAFGCMPPKPTRPGDTWSRESTAPLGLTGSFGTYRLREKFTDNGVLRVDGQDVREVRIATAVAFDAGPEAKSGEAKLPTMTAKGPFESLGADTTLRFDAKTGRFESGRYRVSFIGTLLLSDDGKDSPLKIEQEETRTVRMFCASPFKQR